jgi:hypothetical protein
VALGVGLQPRREPLGVRGLEARFLEGEVQGAETFGAEGPVVVQLPRFPRLTRVRITCRVAGRVKSLNGNPVRHDVVRVGIAAVLVIAEDDVGLERADQPHQRGSRVMQRQGGEGPGRQGRKRIAFRQARIHKAQPPLLDAQDPGGPLHLQAPGARHVPFGMRLAFHCGVLDVPA